MPVKITRQWKPTLSVQLTERTLLSQQQEYEEAVRPRLALHLDIP